MLYSKSQKLNIIDPWIALAAVAVKTPTSGLGQPLYRKHNQVDDRIDFIYPASPVPRVAQENVEKIKPGHTVLNRVDHELGLWLVVPPDHPRS